MKNIESSINYLVKQKAKFAIYCLPNSNDISLVVSLGKNKEEAFIIQDFDSSNETYRIEKDIFLQNEHISISNLEKYNLKEIEIGEEQTNFNVFNKEQYENYVSTVVENCKTGKIEKAVPARIISKQKPKNFNLGAYFLKLVREYKTAFVNLYYHPNCGLWIVATPELLLKKTTKNLYETFSLAGTKLISKNRNWTAKEIEEQQIVTKYISKVLEKNNCKLEYISKSETINAGLIQHIKTTIKFSTIKKISSIAKIIHPTPAVCGMPLKESFELIKKYEKNQRKNYTGFIGLNFKNNKQLFVNLRCMQILETNFLVYVGAGVTKNSIPEQEWYETENKSRTLLKLL